jgi:RNA polymerase sigma factor (sigma-70 family)
MKRRSSGRLLRGPSVFAAFLLVKRPFSCNSYNISSRRSSSEVWDKSLKVTSIIEQDLRISEVIAQEGARLRNFIRKRVPFEADVEDLLQEVFFELVRANRLLMPVEYVTGWLYSVARNRITDLFRKKKPVNFTDADFENEQAELLDFEALLVSPDAGPEELYLHKLLLDELESALADLPEEQRDVFVAHEIEGSSFKEMAAATGISINTLLARKRYAVQHLRDRLQIIHNDFLRK